jgi:lysophospholipase L1-like esterase
VTVLSTIRTRAAPAVAALAVVALVALVPLVAGVAASPLSAAAGTGSASGAYVALGDSYAAGPGIPNQVEAGCLRSDHDYPALVAAALHPAAFVDVSCSGATTADMTGMQPGAYGIPEPPQFTALSAGTSLVTLSIGGNDIGFAGIAGTCALLSLTNPFGAPCQAHYTAGGTDRLSALIAATAPSIAGALDAIHRRAPSALVLVVGYPDLLPVTGPGCWPVVPLAAGDVAYLRGVELALNQMLASQAAAHRATYVDTYTPSIGHDMCQLLGPKWVEGFLPTLPAAPLHPNELGMQATAADVLAALA